MGYASSLLRNFINSKNHFLFPLKWHNCHQKRTKASSRNAQMQKPSFIAVNRMLICSSSGSHTSTVSSVHFNAPPLYSGSTSTSLRHCGIVTSMIQRMPSTFGGILLECRPPPRAYSLTLLPSRFYRSIWTLFSPVSPSRNSCHHHIVMNNRSHPFFSLENGFVQSVRRSEREAFRV